VSMEPERLEHLKMIQAVIARMAQNSFLLKGWSVTLATGMLAVAIGEKQQGFALLGLLPALAFWGLDAFYMRQEKLFRAHHEDMCAAFGTSPVTFSMDTSQALARTPSWVRMLVTKTVVGLHVPILVVILTVGVFVNPRIRAAVAGCVGSIVRP